MLYQHTVDNIDYRRIGIVGVAPPFEYTGAAGLEAEREDIEGYIGTRLVDNADYPERYRYLADGHTVGPLPLGQHPPQRRGQVGYPAHVRGDVGQALTGQPQTVVLGIALLHQSQITGILGQNKIGPGVGRIGDVAQHGVYRHFVEQVEPA